MHTEEESRSLWCPLVQHEGVAGGSFNRGSVPGNPLNRARTAPQDTHLCSCIGSRCAAWRWAPAPVRSIPCADPLATTMPTRPIGVGMDWQFTPALMQFRISAWWTSPRESAPATGGCAWAASGPGP